MPDASNKSWKDHPVIIAAASFGAALVFAQTVIFPTMTASLQNEVSSLRSQVQEIALLKERLNKSDVDLKVERKNLLASQMNNLFSLGDPYPVGIGKVKIGDNVGSITSAYSEDVITRNPSFWSVKVDNAAFRAVTYFLDRQKNVEDRRVIGQLFFATDSGAPILLDKLIEALGNPVTGPKPDCYLWTVKNLFIKKEDKNYFSISSIQKDCNMPEQ